MTPLDEPRADALAGRLEKILEACLTVQEEVGAVLGRKRAAMVKMNVGDLQRVNAEMEAVASRWAELEAARGETVRALAGLLGRPASHLGLPELIELSGEPRRARLLELRARLKARAVDVTRANEVNHTLAETSLAYVHDMIRLLTHWGESRATYGRDGKPAEPKSDRKSMIDHVA